MRFHENPCQFSRSDMTRTVSSTTSLLGTICGFVFRKRNSRPHISSVCHYNTYHIPSLSSVVIRHSNSNFHPTLGCIKSSMLSSYGLIVLQYLSKVQHSENIKCRLIWNSAHQWLIIKSLIRWCVMHATSIGHAPYNSLIIHNKHGGLNRPFEILVRIGWVAGQLPIPLNLLKVYNIIPISFFH